MHSSRLPVYFIIGCSRSIDMEFLNAVMQGLESFKSACLQVPEAIETIHVSVITAGSDAWQIDPLVPIDRFVSPFLFQEGAGELALGNRSRPCAMVG